MTPDGGNSSPANDGLTDSFHQGGSDTAVMGLTVRTDAAIKRALVRPDRPEVETVRFYVCPRLPCAYWSHEKGHACPDHGCRLGPFTGSFDTLTEHIAMGERYELGL